MRGETVGSILEAMEGTIIGGTILIIRGMVGGRNKDGTTILGVIIQIGVGHGTGKERTTIGVATATTTAETTVETAPTTVTTTVLTTTPAAATVVAVAVIVVAVADVRRIHKILRLHKSLIRKLLRMREVLL
jgi:hypothetical protein